VTLQWLFILVTRLFDTGFPRGMPADVGCKQWFT